MLAVTGVVTVKEIATSSTWRQRERVRRKAGGGREGQGGRITDLRNFFFLAIVHSSDTPR